MIHERARRASVLRRCGTAMLAGLGLNALGIAIPILAHAKLGAFGKPFMVGGDPEHQFRGLKIGKLDRDPARFLCPLPPMLGVVVNGRHGPQG
jgi:hypothetical protein